MLLQALVACAGVTLNAVATALGIPLRMRRCVPKAISTFAARSASPRTPPSASRLSGSASRSDTDATEEQIATLLRLTERYCVVYQTLAHPPALTVARSTSAA